MARYWHAGQKKETYYAPAMIFISLGCMWSPVETFIFKTCNGEWTTTIKEPGVI